MGKLASLAFRQGTPVPAWPSIGKSNTIPDAFLSPRNQKGKGTVGLGYVKAVTDLLTDTIMVGLQAGHDALTISFASGGKNVVVSSERVVQGRSWQGTPAFSGPRRLILLEALCYELHPDV